MGLGLVTVFGGSGFMGRHVVRLLAASGAKVRVAVRDVDAALFLKPMGEMGQVIPVQVNIADVTAVASVVEGADAVVNLVGILSEWGRQSFHRIHVKGARNIAQMAADAGVSQLVHLSAVGADKGSDAHYARTKAAGEEAVLNAFPGATILRPSVVFGPEDDFFNRFAGLARLTPILPVFGDFKSGGVKFQPVYVADVAAAVMAALANPQAAGGTYELGGPRVYTFRQIMELILAETERERILLPMPYAIASLQAWFLEKLPWQILTRDQVKMLKKDNVVGEGAQTLKDLGVEATAVEAILPTYLRRYRQPAAQRPRPQ